MKWYTRDLWVVFFQCLFDQNGEDTFASVTIKPEEDNFTSFRLCLSLKIEAFENGSQDDLHIFQYLMRLTLVLLILWTADIQCPL